MGDNTEPDQGRRGLVMPICRFGQVRHGTQRGEGTSAGLWQSFLSISAITGALIEGVAIYSLGYHGTMYLATVMAR
jgi:hypothetical protein